MKNALQWDSSDTLKEIRTRLVKERSERIILLARVMAGTSLDGKESESGDPDPDPPYTLEEVKPLLEQIANSLVMVYTYGCGDLDTIEELIRKSLLRSIHVNGYKAGKVFFREAMERAKRSARELYPKGPPVGKMTEVTREELKRLRRQIKEQAREEKKVDSRPVGRPSLPEEELARRVAEKSQKKEVRRMFREGFQLVRARVEEHVRLKGLRLIAEARKEYEIALSGGQDLKEARVTVARWLSAYPIEWDGETVVVPKDLPKYVPLSEAPGGTDFPEDFEAPDAEPLSPSQ